MRKMRFNNPGDIRIRSGERFRDLLKWMVRPEEPFVKSIVINTLAVSLLSLAVPLAVQMIINNIGVRTMAQPLVVLCMILFFILASSGLLQVMQTYTIEVLQRRLFVRYGYIISERLTTYQDKFFKEANSQDLINRYFDIIIMQTQMVVFFVNGFGFILQFVIGFALLAFYHPYFLGFAGFMGQFLALNWYLFGPDGVKAGSPEADGKYAVVSWIEEQSRARNMFTSDKGKDFSDKKLTHLFNRWLEVRNHLFNFQFRQHIGLQIFSIIMNIILLGMGGMLVLRAELSVGQLVAAALVVNGIIASLPNLQNFFFSVYNYSTCLDMIARFYDYPLEDQREDAQVPAKYDVTLEDVTFAPNYNFNFSFTEGSKNLVLVRSFSSMKHLYDALMGFSEHTGGIIKYDGKMLSDLDMSAVRNHIQLIADDQFFSGTIQENLTGLSGREVSDTELYEILKRVGLLENIQALPDGIRTQIKPTGFPLSKSQLMALQCARALVLEPKILFVTPDFEQISNHKRQLIFRELLDRGHRWTLIFCTQRYYKGDFDNYLVFQRAEMKALANQQELLKEIEAHG